MGANGRRKAVIWGILVAGAVVLFWFAPLFHLRPLQAARMESSSAAFNAGAFVEKFWSERLLKSSDKAVDAAALVAEIKADPKAARTRHAKTVGLTSTYYYYVSGTGRMVGVEKNSVGLSLGSGASPDITIETGNIFGNAARDATGLLDVNDFANSRDFNDISSEINRRIEERVLPDLRAHAAVGATVKFTGCVEVADEETDLHPLHLIPLIIEIQPTLSGKSGGL